MGGEVDSVSFGVQARWKVLVSFVVLVLLPFAGARRTDPNEIAALQAVRRNFIDPMNNLNSWSKGDPCASKWAGVTCFNRSADDGYLHIQELQLLNMNLSGSLAPELGQLVALEILDVMWNNISGRIPKEIGNITSLVLLLLNGNQLSGSLPDELGYLSNLNRLQIDENYISGPIPKSFKNLMNMSHLHMNNNSISGQIPADICRLPKLLHFLLDNNNLSGYLPLEFSESKSLLIIQVDNNNFSGSSIPNSYAKIKTLVKLSLRNCSLQGVVPDLSEIPELTYLDLSCNQLEGSIPSRRLSENITTIDLSSNKLNGSIPSNFSYYPILQYLSLKDNLLTGSISSSLWDNLSLPANGSFTLDVRNNHLSNISGYSSHPPNVTIMLQGNQICSNENQPNLVKECGFKNTEKLPGSSSNFAGGCLPQSCPKEGFFEYIPASPIPCYCAAPLGVGYRLKSPGFSDFRPYLKSFEKELAHDLGLVWYQLYIDSYIWEEGPRLRMYLKLFPDLKRKFNEREVRQIRDLLLSWKINNRNLLGPYELLNFTLQGPYSKFDLDSLDSKNYSSVWIVLGAVAAAISITICAGILTIISKKHYNYQFLSSKKHSLSNSGISIDGLKGFTFEEMEQSTGYFSKSTEVGRGGYGHVYKGTLADGTIVAIKRAEEGSLQGTKEFCTEIEFLSRLRHRNLVSLVGYCDEESEQMLIYEFMPNGTLRDHLSTRSKKSLNFSKRLYIALGAAKGILYLHTEANPPILHRDIKASNILLDAKFVPKVADFGLSRLAPPPDDEGILHGHISTVVKGTPGYLDPEYFLTHRLTDKSDVYSLGVVFLELLTGKQPISNGRNIVREVRMAHQRGQIYSVVDRWMDCCPPECVEKFSALAIRCCDENICSRPSMSEVVQELESIYSLSLDLDISSDSMVTYSSSSHFEDLDKSSTTLESESKIGDSLVSFR